MTIVKELNELAEKITGTNPKATTDKKALDYIADYYANDDLKPVTNAQAIKNIVDNYSAGSSSLLSKELEDLYNKTNSTIFYVELGKPLENEVWWCLGTFIYMGVSPPTIVYLSNEIETGIYLLVFDKTSDKFQCTNVDTGELKICSYDEDTQTISEVTQ